MATDTFQMDMPSDQGRRVRISYPGLELFRKKKVQEVQGLIVCSLFSLFSLLNAHCHNWFPGSPGVFLQGLFVYGRQGREIFRRTLDQNVCREAFNYSLKQKVHLIAFSEDRCLTLFEHPLVDTLHTTYSEPKKLIFLYTSEGVAATIHPYWAEATGDLASVVQAVPDMLEIVPSGTSKGLGVKMLLDHLGASPDEVMAIGDGENDVEMLQLASLGVALSNGSEKAKVWLM